jgi:hypothetical protein
LAPLDGSCADLVPVGPQVLLISRRIAEITVAPLALK